MLRELRELLGVPPERALLLRQRQATSPEDLAGVASVDAHVLGLERFLPELEAYDRVLMLRFDTAFKHNVRARGAFL